MPRIVYILIFLLVAAIPFGFLACLQKSLPASSNYGNKYYYGSHTHHPGFFVFWGVPWHQRGGWMMNSYGFGKNYYGIPSGRSSSSYYKGGGPKFGK